jgi:predicted chitinase
MTEQLDVAGLVAQQLKSQGFTPRAIIATLGNIGKETGFQLKEENLNYAHTPNDRIRSIFGAERTAMTDEALTVLKQSPEGFADHMYGAAFKIGKGMDNTQPGDGWRFRGRGFIQVTGRANYTHASKDLYGDTRLADSPELLNDPAHAATVCGWFLQKAVPSMAKRMGLDPATCSQADMNLLYTSAIAGQPVKRGVGYLGTEVITKVDNWADKLKGVVDV